MDFTRPFGARLCWGGRLLYWKDYIGKVNPYDTEGRTPAHDGVRDKLLQIFKDDGAHWDEQSNEVILPEKMWEEFRAVARERGFVPGIV